MIERKTVVDQVECTRFFELQVRIALLMVEGGVELDGAKWHRTVLDHVADVDLQMSAVNAHLQEMGQKPVAEADIEWVRSEHALMVSRMTKDNSKDTGL